jgi:hypothetical protein
MKSLVLAAAILLASPAPSLAQNLAHLHDFDFLMGDWVAHHRRLKARLTGSTEWITYGGTVNQRPVMGGWGNSGDNVFDMPTGVVKGVSLRAYDQKTGEWLVWWLDGRDPVAGLGPPIRGRFEGGVGVFISDDTFEGRPIKVRVTWTRPTPTTARWEQAFSPDGGKTWEVNWITDFTRPGAKPQ